MDEDVMPNYDVFISYRSGPDQTTALALYEIFKNFDLSPAIDCYDFSPEQTFLDEMARCVLESRFTIVLISSRYESSHWTQEEAMMQRIVDSKDKQRRLIVVYIEDHPAPLWLQSLVGVRLYNDKNDKNSPELKRLLKLMLRGRENKKSDDNSTNSKIDRILEKKWQGIVTDIARYGLYGAAGYGVLSVLADSDLDVLKEGAKDTVGDMLSDSVDGVHRHIVDNVHDIVRGGGALIKNIFDIIF